MDKRLLVHGSQSLVTIKIVIRQYSPLGKTTLLSILQSSTVPVRLVQAWKPIKFREKYPNRTGFQALKRLYVVNCLNFKNQKLRFNKLSGETNGDN